MKISVTIQAEAEADVDIDISENILKDVMRYHNGDFKQWAKENYNDFVNTNDFDFNLDSCYFDEKEAEDLLKKSRDILGFDENMNIIKSVAFRTQLKKRQCDTPTIDDELEEFRVDIEKLKICLDYVDVDNPKVELNYIFLDGTNIVATDSSRLIFIENNKYNYDDILFPPEFVEPMLDDAECFINQWGILLLKYKNKKPLKTPSRCNRRDKKQKNKNQCRNCCIVSTVYPIRVQRAFL